MKRKETVEVYTCDNPECQKELIGFKGEEMPSDFHIKHVFLIDAGGTPADDVYACGEPCVVPAIYGAMDRGRR